MNFRQSLNNMIDSSRPESPTDAMFLFGGVVVFLAPLVAMAYNTTVPHYGEMCLLLGSIKAVKVLNNKVTERKAPDAPEVQQ